jgi:pimeloyl-ACP methyl ester carboxylesterase
MNRKATKSLTIVVAFLILVIVLPVLVSYSWFKRDMQAAHDRVSGDSKILRTDKYTIEYSVKGDGIPVLLLHGAGGGLDQGLWMGKTFLGDGYKFISVSRFGYLNSPIPSGASIKSQAAAYAALLDHLNIDKVVVVGGSAGGSSAMQFANDYPNRSRALILVSAVSMVDHSLDDLPVQVRIIHLIQQSDYVYWVFTELLQSTILELMGIPPSIYKNYTPEQKELAQAMLDDMHPMSLRYAGTFNDNVMIQNYDLTKSKISVPTLIVHSKDDALVGNHHANYTHKNIRQSELVLFEDGGHAMLSKIYDIRKLTRDFISRNTK